MERDRFLQLTAAVGLAVSLLGCAPAPTEEQYLTGTIQEIAEQNNGVISEIPTSEGACYLYTFAVQSLPGIMDEKKETDLQISKNFDVMNRSLLRLGKSLDERFLLFHKSPIVGVGGRVQVVSKHMPLNWYRRDLLADQFVDDMRYMAITTSLSDTPCTTSTGIKDEVLYRLHQEAGFQSLLKKQVETNHLQAVPTSTPEVVNFVYKRDKSLTAEERAFIQNGGLLLGEIASGIVMPEDWYLAGNPVEDYCYVYDASQKNQRSIVNNMRSVIDYAGVTHTCKFDTKTNMYKWVPESSLLRGGY